MCGSVGPGDVLNTIGRPHLSIARRIISISSFEYGTERSSTFTKSSPHEAYSRYIASYHACPASLLRTPNISGHQPHFLFGSPASAAVNFESAIGVFAFTAWRGIPRIM